MKRYVLYILKRSIDRKEPLFLDVGQVNMEWSKVVLANSRTHAVEKCHEDIGKIIGKITDPSIKFVSVFVGLKNSVTEKAERLNPIQVDVSTAKIRTK